MFKQSDLNKNRYNGWSNKDTYLYSLTIDDDEKGGAFRKVVQIANKNDTLANKKLDLVLLLQKIGNENNLNVSLVNFEEILKTYKNEKLETLDSIMKKAKTKRSKI